MKLGRLAGESTQKFHLISQPTMLSRMQRSVVRTINKHQSCKDTTPQDKQLCYYTVLKRMHGWPNYRKQLTVTWYCYFIFYIFFSIYNLHFIFVRSLIFAAPPKFIFSLPPWIACDFVAPGEEFPENENHRVKLEPIISECRIFAHNCDWKSSVCNRSNPPYNKILNRDSSYMMSTPWHLVVKHYISWRITSSQRRSVTWHNVMRVPPSSHNEQLEHNICSHLFRRFYLLIGGVSTDSLTGRTSEIFRIINGLIHFAGDRHFRALDKVYGAGIAGNPCRRPSRKKMLHQEPGCIRSRSCFLIRHSFTLDPADINGWISKVFGCP